MACFHPLKGYRARSRNGNGSRSIVFQVKDGFADRPVMIACGQCIGCRLERSRQWAVRCMHEAKLYENNCFITLTYSDSFLPTSRSLVFKDFQDFMKRLRKRYGSGIRFFHCGEYGERFGRPHYHACIFNFDFPDKELWKVNHVGDNVYTSKSLDALWGMGHASIGAVTFESAAYVARYVVKKRTGAIARTWYEYISPETGEVFDRTPEYTTMSRRPGIGHGHIRRYMGDVYSYDFVVVNGVKARPPRYYDGVYEVEFPSDFARLKARRVRKGKKHADNNTPDRLKVREELQELRLKRLKRSAVE